MIEAIEQATPSQVMFHRAAVERRRRLNPPPVVPVVALDPPSVQVQPPPKLGILQCTIWPDWVISIAHDGNPLPFSRPYPSLTMIVETVAQFYGVRVLDLLSARRTASIVRPRQVACYLAKSLTPKSLPEIGRKLGGRDHTTILWAVRKITDLVESDIELADECNLLRQIIAERMAA